MYTSPPQVLYSYVISINQQCIDYMTIGLVGSKLMKFQCMDYMTFWLVGSKLVKLPYMDYMTSRLGASKLVKFKSIVILNAGINILALWVFQITFHIINMYTTFSRSPQMVQGCTGRQPNIVFRVNVLNRT